MTKTEELELEANILDLKSKITSQKNTGTHLSIIGLILIIVSFCSFNMIPIITFIGSGIFLFIAYKFFYKMTFNIEVLKSIEKSDFEFFK